MYDFLSPLELLDYTKKHSEKICIGKADGLHLKEQGAINRLLYRKALEYKKVVRLKGGDPFIFSRGAEEAQYLFNKKINYEVIPGITSAIAGPESAGIPLTVKNELSSVAILTGRKKNPRAKIDVPNCDTLIYLMAVVNIAKVVKALIKEGKNKNTPCAFIEKATRKDSRVIRSTISEIVEKAKKYKLRPPAVLIVGKVVNNIILEKNEGRI